MFQTTECKLGAASNMHEYAQIQQHYLEKCKIPMVIVFTDTGQYTLSK